MSGRICHAEPGRGTSERSPLSTRRRFFRYRHFCQAEQSRPSTAHMVRRRRARRKGTRRPGQGAEHDRPARRKAVEGLALPIPVRWRRRGRCCTRASVMRLSITAGDRWRDRARDTPSRARRAPVGRPQGPRARGDDDAATGPRARPAAAEDATAQPVTADRAHRFRRVCSLIQTSPIVQYSEPASVPRRVASASQLAIQISASSGEKPYSSMRTFRTAVRRASWMRFGSGRRVTGGPSERRTRGKPDAPTTDRQGVWNSRVPPPWEARQGRDPYSS